MPLLNKDPKIWQKEVKDPIIKSVTPATLSVRALSNGPVISSPQWTRFCTTSIDMTAAKDEVKISGILDTWLDFLERLLRRLL